MRNPTIMDYFKNKAEEWDTPIKIERTEKFVTELLKNHTPSRSDKVLDYGCGTGLVGIEMSKITREIVYIDKSEAMLNVLRQKLNSNKNGLPGNGIRRIDEARTKKQGHTVYKDPEVEFYNSGRYFTVTGDRKPNTSRDIQERSGELKALRDDLAETLEPKNKPQP